MRALKIALKMKKEKTDIEQGTLDAIQNSYDYSSQNQIEPLIKYINEIEFSNEHNIKLTDSN